MNLILTFLLAEWKEHPVFTGLLMVVMGWIGNHYQNAHEWLSLVLMVVSILGGSASLVLVGMKIVVVNAKRKFYNNQNYKHDGKN